MGRVEFEQGSQEWLEWRKGGIGGSDAACILGENPWRSAYDLWCLKTGRKPEQTMNAAMQRGVDLEPVARQTFEEITGWSMPDACFQDDEYEFLKCSVDGIGFCGDDILEIKCPGEKAHEKALMGGIPAHYKAQMQHCMMVTGAKRCYFFSYRPEDQRSPHAMIRVERDDQYIEKLKAAEIEFWSCVVNDVPPETDSTDYLINDDEEALSRSERYLEKLAIYNEAKMQLEIAKEGLLDCTDDGNMIVGKVKCTRVVRKGAIDYKQLHAEFGITDEVSERFRKPESSFWKLTETK